MRELYTDRDMHSVPDFIQREAKAPTLSNSNRIRKDQESQSLILLIASNSGEALPKQEFHLQLHHLCDFLGHSKHSGCDFDSTLFAG